MSRPKLTIGIPFYNAADTLPDAVRCIFAQTYQDWELILAYDGSTDGSDELAKRIKDSRVRVIGDGTRRYIEYRLNQIIKESRGEFIARMDGDDLCDPTRLQKQVDFLESHPDVDLVGTDRFSLGPDDVLIGRRNHPVTHDEICRAPLRRGFFICLARIVARNAWFQKHPYPKGYRAEDAALWLSSWHESKFANIPDPLYYYREYETYDFCKYCDINISIIRMIWDFGRKTHNWFQILTSMAGRVARIGIYGAMTVLHLHNYLVGKRSCPPSEEDVQRFEQAMEIIRNTKVPGLDGN